MNTRFKRSWIAVLPIVLVTGVYLGSQTLSSNADATTPVSMQPGSVDDPLVTKSYLEERLRGAATGGGTGSAPAGMSEAAVKELLAAEIKKVKDELKQQQPAPGTGTPNPAPVPTPGNDTAVTVVQLKQGQTLYAGAGTELIVRTGNTIAVSNDDNGIPDVTAGKDLGAGTAIPNNHLLLFPREGRGVKPVAKNPGDIYVMVKGSYLVLNE